MGNGTTLGQERKLNHIDDLIDKGIAACYYYQGQRNEIITEEK